MQDPASNTVPWVRVTESETHAYSVHGEHLVLLVYREDERWIARVVVWGAIVHQSEHEARDHAMSICEQSARRACRLRRFEKAAPRMPELPEEPPRTA